MVVSMTISVLHVSRPVTPLKVVPSVVVRVTILVVNLFQVVRVSMEQHRYCLVDVLTRPIIGAKRKISFAAFVG